MLCLMALQRDSCRAPVAGEGAHTMFCGAEVANGGSYCAECARRMYVPSRRYVESQTLADRLAGEKYVRRRNCDDKCMPVDRYVKVVRVSKFIGEGV